MKFAFLLILISFAAQAQVVDFSNTQKEIVPEPYNGTDIRVDEYASRDYLLGLIGQECYYLDKECTISELVMYDKYSHNDSLILQCDQDRISVSNVDDILLKKGIENLSWIKNDGYSFIHSDSTYNLEGKKINIIPSTSFRVKDIFYCKVDSYGYDYSLCASTEDMGTFEIVTEYDQPERRPRLRIKSLDKSLELYCCEPLNVFTNSYFKHNISNKIVEKGMTFDEVDLALESYLEVKENYFGHEMVVITDIIEGWILFKNGKVLGITH